MTPPSWATRLLIPEVALIPVLAGLMVYWLLQAHPRLRAYPRLADRLRALARARRSWSAAADPAPPPPSLLAAIGGPLLTEAGRLARRVLPTRGRGPGVPLATRLELVSPGATVEWFTGVRLLGLGVGLVLAGLLASLPGMQPGWAPTWPLPLVVGLGLLGLWLPRRWLDRRWAARRTRLRRALAPVLGSLASVLENGQSVPTAIEELPRRRPGLLAREFTWALEEARSGRQPTLADALRAMARRNDVPELSKAVTVLRQSLTHNLAAAATLRHQVEVFHVRARAERRRRAGVMQQWQVAVTAPLVLVLLVFLLYPAWPRVAAALGLVGFVREAPGTIAARRTAIRRRRAPRPSGQRRSPRRRKARHGCRSIRGPAPRWTRNERPRGGRRGARRRASPAPARACAPGGTAGPCGCWWSAGSCCSSWSRSSSSRRVRAGRLPWPGSVTPTAVVASPPAGAVAPTPVATTTGGRLRRPWRRPPRRPRRRRRRRRHPCRRHPRRGPPAPHPRRRRRRRRPSTPGPSRGWAKACGRSRRPVRPVSMSGTVAVATRSRPVSSRRCRSWDVDIENGDGSRIDEYFTGEARERCAASSVSATRNRHLARLPRFCRSNIG